MQSRCSLLLQTDWICLCSRHDRREPCKNVWTDRDAGSRADSRVPTNLVLDGTAHRRHLVNVRWWQYVQSLPLMQQLVCLWEKIASFDAFVLWATTINVFLTLLLLFVEKSRFFTFLIRHLCGLRRRKARFQTAAATLSGNSLRQAVHTHRVSVHQATKLVAALLRVARVTAGLAESNGSLQPGLWFTSPAGWLPRTGISSGTLLSAIEYGLPLPFWFLPWLAAWRSG